MVYSVTAGTGALTVRADAVRCGADLAVAVTGGTGPHIGASALGEYEPERGSATVSCITVRTHRDDRVACRFAKRLAAALGCTVSVSAGLHVDGAGETEIAALVENSERCLDKLLAELKEDKI